jgi:hypothetical protein
VVRPAATVARAAAPELSATSTLTVTPGPLDHMVLSPPSATIHVDQGQAYRVEGFDTYDNSRGELTESTEVTISSPGTCTNAHCTASVAGRYTVTATNGTLSDTAELTVLAVPASRPPTAPPAPAPTVPAPTTPAPTAPVPLADTGSRRPRRR